jgi:hypothetical protein
MVRSRVYGILAGYEDQNDHDTLRHDPVFKLVADRSPGDDHLASQPTLSRVENALSIQSLRWLPWSRAPGAHLPWADRSRSPATCRRVRPPRPCRHAG